MPTNFSVGYPPSFSIRTCDRLESSRGRELDLESSIEIVRKVRELESKETLESPIDRELRRTRTRDRWMRISREPAILEPFDNLTFSESRFLVTYWICPCFTNSFSFQRMLEPVPRSIAFRRASAVRAHGLDQESTRFWCESLTTAAANLPNSASVSSRWRVAICSSAACVFCFCTGVSHSAST